MSINDGLVLMVGESFGVYVPQCFIDDENGWQGISTESRDIIAKGPDNDGYWEAWDEILDNAGYMDKNGNEWRLYQDGDLWAYCAELMDNETHSNFFGGMKPAPDDAYEFEFCADCVMALVNGDYSGMDDLQEKATKQGLESLSAEYNLIYDGEDYGFRQHRCDCCDSLPSNRRRVFGFKKVK